jgi:hypothetical protein
VILQELKQAAGIQDNPDQEGLDLFAELIVRECDLYARRNWEHGTLLGGDLLNHFGIER